MTLAGLVQQDLGVREMALAMGRSASTLSRELRRNAQPTGYAVSFGAMKGSGSIAWHF